MTILPEASGPHPLITLSQRSDISSLSLFCVAALELTIDGLRRGYDQERQSAPLRAGRGKKYFVGHDGIPSTGSGTKRGEEHLAIALFNAHRTPNAPLPLPNSGALRILDYQVPLKARRSDAAMGKVDLLAVDHADDVAVIELKVLGRATPETPLRAAIEGLAYAAVIEANLATIREEIRQRWSDIQAKGKLRIIVLAPSDYWRFFEASRSAGDWATAMSAFAAKVQQAAGVGIEFFELVNCKWELGLNRTRPILSQPTSCRDALGRR